MSLGISILTFSNLNGVNSWGARFWAMRVLTEEGQKERLTMRKTIYVQRPKLVNFLVSDKQYFFYKKAMFWYMFIVNESTSLLVSSVHHVF